MSNYIKNNCLNAAGQRPVAKVINSNPRMEQLIKEWNAKPKNLIPSANPDGFSEGLAVTEVYKEPEVTPEMVLEEARCKADQIMNDAHAKAVALREQTEQEAAAVYEEQRQAGFMAGQAEAEDFLAQKMEALEAEYTQKAQALQLDYEERHAHMEQDIVEAIASVMERTFGIFMEDKQDLMVFLVKKTLQGIENGNHFRIRVSPENADALSEALPELLRQLGNEASVDIHPEASFTEDDCIIETEYGLYHCGGKLQMDNLIKELKTLCV